MPEPADERALLRDFLAGRDILCPRCGYNLRGLTTDTCPECEGPVELTLRGEEQLWQHRRLVLLATGLGAAGCTISGIASAFSLARMLQLPRPSPPFATLYWITWSLSIVVDGVIAFMLARAFRRLLRGPGLPGAQSDSVRSALMTCAVVSLIWGIYLIVGTVLRFVWWF